MGKTSLKTAWRPRSLRLVGDASVCRNSMYELVCNSIKLRGAMISLNLPKLIRSVARDGILAFAGWPATSQTVLFTTSDTTQEHCVQPDIRCRGDSEPADPQSPQPLGSPFLNFNLKTQFAPRAKRGGVQPDATPQMGRLLDFNLAARLFQLLFGGV